MRVMAANIESVSERRRWAKGVKANGRNENGRHMADGHGMAAATAIIMARASKMKIAS